ncbi:hypothetical protein M422DRAFT_61682 [Sphaerobolus stellatus SS14]|uniref:Protein kinase domain-containing protein n=1 Tax=Sphaerobolus stellatus (strain SS14) TaxID=990650 RepID=A0A0C9UQ12_SPHS4|nr:hypothetical protein M422DRAFT_61682 [Sphaerobolus stellatus SS14]
MEANRIWHDPVVEIYSCCITPGVRSVTDDDWMSEAVAKYVREYYRANQALPHWNTIHTTLRGNPVTFETQPDERVARPIQKQLSYGTRPEDKLSTTPFDQVREKFYIARRIDHCLWNGRECVYKRIEFDVDIEHIEREIRTREAIIGCIEGEIVGENREHEMIRRFNIMLILAVVTKGKEPGQDGNVAGFLMPFLGHSLESLAETASDSTVPVTELQLWDLACGVRELSQCGIMHGDINDWNTILPQPTTFPSGVGQVKLLLIDLGEVGPGYEGDSKALGDLFLWCLEHAPILRNSPGASKRVEAAAEVLKEGNIDRALEVLSPGNARI